MHLEPWMIAIFIVAAGAWAEWRHFKGKSEGKKIGITLGSIFALEGLQHMKIIFISKKGDIVQYIDKEKLNIE